MSYLCSLFDRHGAPVRVAAVTASDHHAAVEECRMLLHAETGCARAELHQAAGALVATFLRTLDEAGEPVVETTVLG